MNQVTAVVSQRLDTVGDHGAAGVGAGVGGVMGVEERGGAPCASDTRSVTVDSSERTMSRNDLLAVPPEVLLAAGRW